MKYLLQIYFSESRSHCVDLETAYKQGCQKINNTMQVRIENYEIDLRLQRFVALYIQGQKRNTAHKN